MEQRLHKSLRLAATLLVALSASSVWGEKAPIDLTFSAEGESSNVQSVVVSNLTHPDIGAVALSGTSILRLVDAEDYQTLIESVEEAKVISEPIITPNPAVGDGTLIFDAKSDGPVRVSVYTTGGMLLDAATLNVSKGRNTARIPAQGTGIFIVNIDGQGVKSSTRWICGGSKSFSGIALGGAQQWANATLPTRNVFRAPSQNRADAVANVVVMEFNEGDVLRFEGTSGKMTTIVVNAPQRSHSVPFFFYPCVDASGNNYPIIEAGGLLWMAEDLRAMKRLDGVSIFYKDEDTDWASAVQNQESASMAMVVNDNDIYYTYSAARIALPEGFEAQVRPRSGLALKKGITVLNAPGTIDADYRGEVGVILCNLSNEEFIVNDGERIAQMVIARHETADFIEVEELDETERGAGGYGHTGVK